MNDTHIELYKKYRPNRWKGLVGQQKTARSLQAAIKANKVPTAYIFSGERGCGKTTSAMILAKAINCLDPIVETADPCNKCDVCVSIDDGSQIGVTYFSAAQKSGVDDMRDLVNQARLSTPLKRQVFIIDEIHNLRGGKGFEALLIPLEEKTMPALFIFCTTEIEKVPETILSRIQARRFNLVPAETMNKYVRYILQKENTELDDEAIQAAVRNGRGSVRDTLTALESIMETGDYNISQEGELLKAFSSLDSSEVLKIVAQSIADGQDGRIMAEQMFEDLRDILLVASGVSGELVGAIPVDDPVSVAKGLRGKMGIFFALEEIGDAINQISSGGDARIHFEIGLIKSIEKLKKLKKAQEARA